MLHSTKCFIYADIKPILAQYNVDLVLRRKCQINDLLYRLQWEKRKKSLPLHFQLREWWCCIFSFLRDILIWCFEVRCRWWWSNEARFPSVLFRRWHYYKIFVLWLLYLLLLENEKLSNWLSRGQLLSVLRWLIDLNVLQQEISSLLSATGKKEN